tara:strand:- start:231 stop:518 length:288 start_codon:yes stop_codon:yes gene_type:complete
VARAHARTPLRTRQIIENDELQLLRQRNDCEHDDTWCAPTILVNRLGESATDALAVQWLDHDTCRWCSSCSAAAEAQFDAGALLISFVLLIFFVC